MLEQRRILQMQEKVYLLLRRKKGIDTGLIRSEYPVLGEGGTTNQA